MVVLTLLINYSAVAITFLLSVHLLLAYLWFLLF